VRDKIIWLIELKNKIKSSKLERRSILCYNREKK
jgi:hypothetical protein